MNEIETKKEEEETLALWEVFQGVIAMFIGVQSEKNRERQFKYGKLHQFIIVGIIITLIFFIHIILLVKFAMNWAGA
jgi:Na+/melibiose symporter-like transporter